MNIRVRRGHRPFVWGVSAVLWLSACGQDDAATNYWANGGHSGGAGSAGSTSDGGVDADSGGFGGNGAAGAGAAGTDGGSSMAGQAGASGTGGAENDKQIIVAPGNPAWLSYEGAGPFFLCAPGDPEGFLYRGNRNADGTRSGDQQTIIDKLAPTGANGIYMMAIRSHGGDGAQSENPFVDSDPAKGLSAPILDQWEQWLTSMDAAGIVAYFFLYDDSARIWNTGDVVGTQEKAFIEGLVNRFEHHKHLIWVVAEEYAERYSQQRVSNIAAAIRSADDQDHVIAVHQLNGLSFDFATDPNIDQFAIQYNEGTASGLHAGMVTARWEAGWSYNLNMAEAANHGTGAVARKKNWAIAMGGAYVMVLGWDIASTTVTDLEDCGRLRRFMESTSFQQMLPHDELARASTEFVLATPGESYIAYASAAGDLGLADLASGVYDLRWLDAVTGTEVTESSVSVSGGDHTFSRPSGLGAEVAVYITRQ
jgi:hypothetical protein